MSKSNIELIAKRVHEICPDIERIQIDSDGLNQLLKATAWDLLPTIAEARGWRASQVDDLVDIMASVGSNLRGISDLIFKEK